MRTRHYTTLGFLLIFSMLLMMTCKKDSPTGPDDTNTNGTSGTTITSAGGKVEDSYGASVTVPAGALSSNMNISVRTIHADSIPTELQSTVVGNMIECLPHGATFLQPVTIVLPVTSGFTYDAGDSVHLYYYNTDSSMWELAGIPAMVTADGQHFQASVTHFTDFGVDQFGRYGGDVDFNNTTDAGQLKSKADEWSSDYLGDIGGIYTKKRYQDCCTYLANARFEFRFSSPSYTDVYTKGYGEQASCDRTENLTFSVGNPGLGYHVNVRVQLCWAICNPDFLLSASPDHFNVPEDKGQTAAVTATVKCGKGPGAAFSDQSVKFVVVSGPGNVDPPMTKTNSTGTANGIYTIETRGIANIRAEVQTCSSLKPTFAESTTQVVVDTLIPDYIYAKVIIDHGGAEMPWTFHDEIHMVLNLKVEDDSVTVSGGEGSHYATCISNDGYCMIVGLVTPDFTPTGTATRNGNSLDIEINPNCTINFTYYCDFGDDNIIDRLVPAYGYMVSSIIAQHVKGTLPMEFSSFVKGSGTESFGEDLPVSYDYELIFSSKTHP